MHGKLPKLTLNQETIQNLTSPERANTTTPIFFCKTIPAPTCPECPAPVV